ncbi:MAG: hypothetical protein ACR5LF_14985 [Symbiopectobacterium sp.]
MNTRPGTGGLRLFGTGTATLTANSTYSGFNLLEAGTLQARSRYTASRRSQCIQPRFRHYC